MPVESSTPSPPSNRALSLIAILGGLAVILIVGFVFWALTRVYGSEFSPTHFQSRSFDFREIPFFGIQLSGIDHTSTTSSTALYLSANKLIQAPVTAPRRWDLVQINRSSHPADAEILVTYLGGYGGSHVDWEKWSKDHPKTAAVFWPMIQQMAIDGLYLMMPRVFELAENETDPIKLKEDLDSYIIEELPSMARDLACAGRRQQAVDALKSATSRYPNETALTDALANIEIK